nr:hypothetical protein [Candidatus Sigynarchaeota archaeon]
SFTNTLLYDLGLRLQQVSPGEYTITVLAAKMDMYYVVMNIDPTFLPFQAKFGKNYPDFNPAEVFNKLVPKGEQISGDQAVQLAWYLSCGGISWNSVVKRMLSSISFTRKTRAGISSALQGGLGEAVAYYNILASLKDPAIQMDCLAYFGNMGITTPAGNERLGVSLSSELRQGKAVPDMAVTLHDTSSNTDDPVGVIQVEVKACEESSSTNQEGFISNLVTGIPGLVQKYGKDAFAGSLFYIAENFGKKKTGHENMDYLVDLLFTNQALLATDNQGNKLFDQVLDHVVSIDPVTGSLVCDAIATRYDGTNIQLRFVRDHQIPAGLPLRATYGLKAMYKIGTLQNPATARLSNPATMVWNSVQCNSIDTTTPVATQARPTWLWFTDLPGVSLSVLQTISDKYTGKLVSLYKGIGDRDTFEEIKIDKQARTIYREWLKQQGYSIPAQYFLFHEGDFSLNLRYLVLSKFVADMVQSGHVPDVAIAEQVFDRLFGKEGGNMGDVRAGLSLLHGGILNWLSMDINIQGKRNQRKGTPVATLDTGYWRRAQALMQGMIEMANDVVKGNGPTFSGGIADELGGRGFYDAIYGARLGINHWGDRSTWDVHFTTLKA